MTVQPVRAGAKSGVGWLLACSMLTSCSVTNPGDAASIRYRLPTTEVNVITTIELRGCEEEDFIKGNILPDNFKNELAGEDQQGIVCSAVSWEIVSRPAFREKYYSVSGADLASSKVARNLQITVNEHDVITAVNATNTDKTPAIIGSALKLAVTALAATGRAAPGEEGQKQYCYSDELTGHYKNYTSMLQKVLRLRKLLDEKLLNYGTYVAELNVLNNEKEVAKKEGEIAKNEEEIASITSAIEGLASRAADIRMKYLTLRLTNKLNLKDQKDQGNELTLSSDEFTKMWLAKSENCSKLQDFIDKTFGAKWELKPEPDADDALTPSPVSEPKPADCDKSKGSDCRLCMVVPNAVTRELVITGTGDALKIKSKGGPADFQVKTAIVPYHPAKAKHESRLCLDVRFGESRTVNLKFDDFGRKKSLTWDSQARADTVMSALAGYGSSVSGIVGAFESPTEAQRKQAEIERLTREQNYNLLKKCEAYIDAGGFTCPPPN